MSAARVVRKVPIGTRWVVTAVAAGLSTLGVALPASAAISGGTTATLTVLPGVLSITVPSGPVNLGTIAQPVSATNVTGSLGQVQVSDARGGNVGWVASVISTAFTNQSPPSNTIIPTAISYTAGTITRVGTALYTANDPTNLTGVIPAVTATGVIGNNSATWTPTITVVVAGGAPPGTYDATITHSVA
jgi:hypothetical protein